MNIMPKIQMYIHTKCTYITKIQQIQITRRKTEILKTGVSEGCSRNLCIFPITYTVEPQKNHRKHQIFRGFNAVQTELLYISNDLYAIFLLLH